MSMTSLSKAFARVRVFPLRWLQMTMDIFGEMGSARPSAVASLGLVILFHRE